MSAPEGRTPAPGPPTICKCGGAKSYHRPQDHRDHEYEPRYEPNAWREGYRRGAAAGVRVAEPQPFYCVNIEGHPGRHSGWVNGEWSVTDSPEGPVRHAAQPQPESTVTAMDPTLLLDEDEYDRGLFAAQPQPESGSAGTSGALRAALERLIRIVRQLPAWSPHPDVKTMVTSPLVQQEDVVNAIQHAIARAALAAAPAEQQP